MSEVVLFELLKTQSGKQIAIATLNSERSLNALSHEMVALLYPQLVAWQEDSNIALVLLQGAGEKAFCAGGDIVNLYENMAACPGEYSASIESYFTDEYQLDHLIHSYSKPFVVWGSGIVMGGGLGLMAGASHRVVTESSRIAMPEISIGLFPDVGGSYFLNRMPDNCGLFLGLTGAAINAADAKFINLADHFISNADKSLFIEEIQQISWGDTIALNNEKLTSLMKKLEQKSKVHMPLSNVHKHKALIDQVTDSSKLEDIVAAIAQLKTDDKWLNRAQKSLAHGSALSVWLTHQLINKAKGLSLAQCLQLELNAAVKCGKFGEFQEGVRALLIEKDNSPAWKFASVSDIDKETKDWFITSKWLAPEHPLALLN
ncbi:enoyl-CoA hydratase/isomerase family protein [Thalassomonas sp. M1454]|uniref:enoyl-CoA hydratase/isomerase family protein n=1 Tax=Thalassomonas sp. M1454 TaxID=2594477 RepID=UPI0011815933|nr:enoyl-CoA hydratase/isomerase family protein [Thalassomonas sp. M1454]TRX55632.1 enoyl-CoA hydratase/isomerase family protein [Thalassomonas sp. M1454]